MMLPLRILQAASINQKKCLSTHSKKGLNSNKQIPGEGSKKKTKQKIKSLKLTEEGDEPTLSAEISLKVSILEGEEQTVLPSVGQVCGSAGWEEPQKLTASILTTPEEHGIMTC